MRRGEVLAICRERKLKMTGEETKDDLLGLIAEADKTEKHEERYQDFLANKGEAEAAAAKVVAIAKKAAAAKNPTPACRSQAGTGSAPAKWHSRPNNQPARCRLTWKKAPIVCA